MIKCMRDVRNQGSVCVWGGQSVGTWERHRVRGAACMLDVSGVDIGLFILGSLIRLHIDVFVPGDIEDS